MLLLEVNKEPSRGSAEMSIGQKWRVVARTQNGMHLDLSGFLVSVLATEREVTIQLLGAWGTAEHLPDIPQRRL